MVSCLPEARVRARLSPREIVFGQIVTGTGVSPYTLACRNPTSYTFYVFIYVLSGDRPKGIAGSENKEDWTEKKFHFYFNGL